MVLIVNMLDSVCVCVCVCGIVTARTLDLQSGGCRFFSGHLPS